MCALVLDSTLTHKWSFTKSKVCSVLMKFHNTNGGIIYLWIFSFLFFLHYCSKNNTFCISISVVGHFMNNWWTNSDMTKLLEIYFVPIVWSICWILDIVLTGHTESRIHQYHHRNRLKYRKVVRQTCPHISPRKTHIAQLIQIRSQISLLFSKHLTLATISILSSPLTTRLHFMQQWIY